MLKDVGIYRTGLKMIYKSGEDLCQGWPMKPSGNLNNEFCVLFVRISCSYMSVETGEFSLDISLFYGGEKYPHLNRLEKTKLSTII